MNKLFCLVFCMVLSAGGWTQRSVLDEYISMGLESNLTLKQKSLDYATSLEKLTQAKSYFFPEVKLQARYSRADGGRTFDMPVGDMMNPVYETLNLLTNGSFPIMELENEEFSFLRTKEHETKMRLIQPIINGDVWYNRKIQEEMVDYCNATREEYMHTLVAEIKTAYYNYLKSRQLIEIIASTDNLLLENLRVANKLHKNNLVTVDQVYNAEAEIAKNEERHASAIKQNKTAQAYFNFLINRKLTDSIQIVSGFQDPQIPVSLEEKQREALQHRQLLNAMNSALNAQTFNLKRNMAKYWPELSFVFDYGFQGETYQFDMDHDFYIASVVLEWPIFQGLRRKSDIQESAIEVKKIETQRKQVEAKINLEVTSVWYEIQKANATIAANKKVMEAVEKSHNVAKRKYSEGLISQIEYLKALNDLRTAKEKYSISQYDYMIKMAEFEKVVASINIEKQYGTQNP